MQNSGEGSKTTPKWITPMLLFIDLYEKVVLAMNRRSAMSDICSTQWKWFEVQNGRWQDYQPANNKTINDAFWAGEQTVKFTTGRRKYSIQFGSMMQANEETGNRRPIMITLKRDEKEKESEASAVKRGRWTKEDAGGEKKVEAETAAKDNKPKTEEGAIQMITVLDPSTGELIPKRVQTQMDPITGQMFQVPFQEVTDDGFNVSVDQVDYYSDRNDVTSLKEEIITILDPVTGEPVQQIFQKASSKKALYDGLEEERGGRGEVNYEKNLMKVMVDPQTGKEIHYSEEMIGTGISDDGTNYSTAAGVAVFKMMTFTDPMSGEPTQQMIQSIVMSP